MLSIDEYLFPRDLDVTDVDIRRTLFIGSCASEDYVKDLRRKYPEKRFDHLLYNYVSELPNHDVSDVDVQVIQLPLRHVVGDKVIDFKYFTENFETIASDAAELLRLMLEGAMKYNREHGLLTIVTNFIVPQGDFVAGLDGVGTHRDLRGLVRYLNEQLVMLVRETKNAYLLDVENIAATMGKRYFLNDFIFFSTHNAFWFPDWNSNEIGRLEEVPHIETISPSHLDQFFGAIWRGIEAYYRIARQIDQVKLVIFDLDDTMWRGIIGEHYTFEQQPMTVGWPFGMHEVVHHLRARGILTAICSKNSLDLVKERWDLAVPLGFMKLEHFTFVEIGWTPKTEAIGRIISSASLTAKSVVFVDDNPVERDAVKSMYPDIRVLAAQPFNTRRILQNSPSTQIARLTAETINRDAMMRSQQEREKSRKALTREEFLQSLNCVVDLASIRSTDDQRFGRAFELLNKTNQFNTTGRRWSFEEISVHLQEGGEIVSFAVSDKFTSYGLVGVALIKQNEIVQFAMSCRILGLDIEASVLRILMSRMSGPIYVALFNETKENVPARTLLPALGFEDQGNGVWQVSRIEGDIASHLKLTGDLLNS
ncbi:HAD superfamily phosphatase (TIGR01681 family)/FkbH-like protein [Rhizobium sp. ERR 922]|uniref:HAD-IIIC family phosphatase n=1 Tax=unclassified Rhizobium TaxID=2613769 RepID=UPI00119E2042|nr:MULTISPECIES: HAD-IIIC family phosphatase [unclassified Rhizobium]TWB51657.1 HAD superfamily phosphatase (TIGR01681 family)/FkbH-like protein [Rhizobium sp. ERR 922]TWB94079.1 HAD superfamily phosphatase (TIGR01681 family)/FkbH-like protein [Rhizobium sp. ERR 942]